MSPTTGAKGCVQADSPVANSLPSYAPEVTFNLRYPGQQWDEETQLSYNVNRYYGPQEGRYIQADPIGLAGGWNRFGYVGGNPLNGIDPEGLQGVIPRGGIGPIVPGQPPAGPQPRPIDPTEPWGPTVPPPSISWPTIFSPIIGPFIGPFTRPIIEGFVDWCMESRGRGERGATGGTSGQGTNNPYKHCRDHPTDPNKIICKDHQTGKTVEKKKPADWPSR